MDNGEKVIGVLLLAGAGIGAYLYFQKKKVPVVAIAAPLSADQLKLDIANTSSSLLSLGALSFNKNGLAGTRQRFDNLMEVILQNLDSADADMFIGSMSVSQLTALKQNLINLQNISGQTTDYERSKLQSAVYDLFDTTAMTELKKRTLAAVNNQSNAPVINGMVPSATDFPHVAV